jgi:hypothetical protein
LGQYRRSPQFFNFPDRSDEFAVILIREPHEQIDAYFLPTEAGFPEAGHRGLQLPRGQLLIETILPHRDCFHPQAQGLEVGPPQPPCYFSGNKPGVEAIGGVAAEVQPPLGQFFQQGQKVVLCLDQQGVVIESHIA